MAHFPGHPRRQSANLINRDAGVIANPALAGTAHPAVQDTVPGKCPNRTIIHFDRELQGDGLEGPAQRTGSAALLQPRQVVHGLLELLAGNVERI